MKTAISRHPAIRWLLTGALALVIGARTLPADVVTLTNGGTLRGEVVSENKENLTLRVKYGTLTIPRNRVKSVRKEASKPEPVETRASAYESAENRVRVEELANEGDLLTSFGRYREALEKFDALKDLDREAWERHRKTVARCHAGYGRRLLEFKRYEQARDHYDRAVELDDSLLGTRRHEIVVARFSPVVREINAHGKVLTEARWEALASEIAALIPLEEDNPNLHYALGICYQELKRYNDAALKYLKVLGKNPADRDYPTDLATLQQTALKVTEAKPIMLSFKERTFEEVSPGPFRTLETGHFVIHHHNDDLAKLVAKGAEYYLRRNYKTFVDKMPVEPWPKKCDIYIYPTQKDYLATSGQADWSPAMASTRGLGNQLLEHHIKTYQDVENLLPSHLSHEITHIIHAAVLGYNGRVPTWLREGIAVRQEPWFKRIRMADAIREAREKGDLMTLDEIFALRGYPPESRVRLFYAQAYALVETLERAGTREQFLRFNQLALTTPPFEAIRQVYGLDRDELGRQWRKHEGDLAQLLENP